MKKIWKIIGIIAAVLVVLVGGLLAWLSWEGSPKEIVSVADEFKPDASWELVKEEIIPPRNSCISVHCPHVHREWRTSSRLTTNDIRERLQASSWNNLINNLEDDCYLNGKDDQQRREYCGIQGYRGSYLISIYVDTDKNDKTRSILAMFVDYRG